MRRYAERVAPVPAVSESPALTVILNGAAGPGTDDTRAEAITRHFRDAGVEARIVAVDGGGPLLEAARRAMSENPTVVVAAGGDGTISAVGAVLAGTDVALGVLPLGTLNHFAKDAGIPLALADAVGTIVAAHQRQVDVGEVNGRVFLNNSSLGIYPDLVTIRERHQEQGRSKRRAALHAAFTVLRRYPFMNVRLTLEGREHVRRTAFVFVGNNEYDTAGLVLGGRDSLSAGTLSLYVGHRIGRWGLFKLVLRALFGRLRQARDFDALTAGEILVESPHRKLKVAADGEVEEMSTPLHFRIRAGALRVIVPAPAVAGSAG